MKPLNPWRDSVLRAAGRLFEDVDRKSLTSQLVLQTIQRIWSLATTSAHATPAPAVKRHQSEDGVMFDIEWADVESGWFLCVTVHRAPGQKPKVALEFSGNPKGYTAAQPTDDDIRTALHDYFHEWKKPCLSG